MRKVREGIEQRASSQREAWWAARWTGDICTFFMSQELSSPSLRFTFTFTFSDSRSTQIYVSSGDAGVTCDRTSFPLHFSPSLPPVASASRGPTSDSCQRHSKCKHKHLAPENPFARELGFHLTAVAHLASNAWFTARSRRTPWGLSRAQRSANMVSTLSRALASVPPRWVPTTPTVRWCECLMRWRNAV